MVQIKAWGGINVLRKDDPVYYKKQLQKLLQQAKDNGLKVIMEGNRVGFKYEFEVGNIKHAEQASVDVKGYEEV